MDATQRAFLARSRAEQLAIEPRLADLERALLALGGEGMVFRPEPDIELILERGRPFAGRSVRVPSQVGDCHRNVALLWRATRARTAIATGWALSSDQLWRQHSWLVRRQVVIETTTKRTRYFGVVLTDTEAKSFTARLALAN